MRSIYLPSDQEIQNRNQQGQYRWTVILGNDKEHTLFFFGSFKEVRLWKTDRSDADLYSYRFNQVTNSPDLAGNLKFIDGNPFVKNTADTNINGIQFANIEPDMQLIPSDKQNIVCAVDTYFDPEKQLCTRYPYSKDVSILYMVVNNVQHGHQMILQQMARSSMFLQSSRF